MRPEPQQTRRARRLTPPQLPPTPQVKPQRLPTRRLVTRWKLLVMPLMPQAKR